MLSQQELYRLLPSMDVLLDTLSHQKGEAWLQRYPRILLKELITSFLDSYRKNIHTGKAYADELTLEALLQPLFLFIEKSGRPHLRRVVNATGVVIHTNLGRSLLAKSAVEAVTEAALYYSNLEMDLATGKRGSRFSHVESLLTRLTGAEAALVVNNNAAAVLLVLDSLCKGGEVIVSRGELVEIGGSFRIPAVMEKGGCTLKEIGTTNRTHLEDYSQAITEQTKAILKVHTSNYRIGGFTKSVTLKELKSLTEKTNVPLIEDLGSGSLCDFTRAGLPLLGDEPPVQHEIASGADLVTFSGDKVLGGPQAGIIVGRADLIEQLKKNHLARALRIDKLSLAALEATLRLYLDPEKALQEIPSLRMIFMPEKQLLARAKKLKSTILRSCGAGLTLNIHPGTSRIGGGAFPERELPTHLVHIRHPKNSAEWIREQLLQTSPVIIGRIDNNDFCLDPRTISDPEFPIIARISHSLL